tara:strand:- start:188 stop:1033 length:846 start_codon:yes stop_codon:yes gene_type:complete
MTTEPIKPIPVIVSGALGRMGQEVIKTLVRTDDCEIVGAVDTSPGSEGVDIGDLIGIDSLNISITADIEGCLCNASQIYKEAQAPVLIDFTHPSVVYKHTRTAIAYGVHPVIGTTGLDVNQLNDLSDFATKASVGGAVIPNFSIGMVLLQQAAAAAASFYDHAELTELHHNQKADAPSGTCIKTAELMEDLGKTFNLQDKFNEKESIDGVRGGLRESGLRLHSIRLPGLVAHQEVIFGSAGETYTLRHDTIDRVAYMPGVILVTKKVRQLNGLIYGLEKII